MKLYYRLVGILDGIDFEISWFDSLDDAIWAIRKSSVEHLMFNFRIETFQCSSSLSCRIIDHQLFIE